MRRNNAYTLIDKMVKKDWIANIKHVISSRAYHTELCDRSGHILHWWKAVRHVSATMLYSIATRVMDDFCWAKPAISVIYTMIGVPQGAVLSRLLSALWCLMMSSSRPFPPIITHSDHIISSDAAIINLSQSVASASNYSYNHVTLRKAVSI